jgi:hypothetical protein
MVPLLGDRISCPVYEKREVNLFFMTLADLDRHLSLHHVDTRIQWGCINCRRCFTKLHGARCHLPKFSGTSSRKEGSYKCEACPMSFSTQRVLSTHERHEHSAIRNEKRKEATLLILGIGQNRRLTSWRSSMNYIEIVGIPTSKLVRSLLQRRLSK